MVGKLRRPTAGIVLALCMVALLPRPGQASQPNTAHPASTSLLGGVNIGGVGDGSLPSEADKLIAAATQLHAKLVRVEVPWSVLEPQRNQLDAPALAYADRLAADAASAGIRIVMMVQSTPCWASSAPPSLLARCVAGRVGRANAWPPREAADYGTFVAYLARRYAAQLAAIEVWNEPDQANEDYLAGPNKPQSYAAILRAAYPVIKQADPAVPVLAGSLVGSNGAFLRALYAAGIKGYYDGLAVHYYNLTLASLRSIHEVQLAYGDHTPLWLDEFGWSSCWPAQKIQQEQACVTAPTQALNLANTFRTLARTPYVVAAVVYKLQDSTSEDFGVLTAAGRRKPSFAALAQVLASPFGSVSPVTLNLRRKRTQVLASGSAPVGDFMELEAFQGRVLRYRAVFTLDRFNRYSIALPAVLGTSGLRVRVYQYASAPGGGAQRNI